METIQPYIYSLEELKFFKLDRLDKNYLNSNKNKIN